MSNARAESGASRRGLPALTPALPRGASPHEVARDGVRAPKSENRDAIALLERLGDATRGELGRELRFDVVLPDSGAAGPTLRDLLRAEAAGLLAPARAIVPPVLPDAG